MAKLIRSNGTETIVHPTGKKWTLKELQTHVGGCIEIIPGIGKILMILDEEGLLKMKPINHKATDIVMEALQGKVLRYQPLIVGDVLILEKGEKM